MVCPFVYYITSVENKILKRSSVSSLGLVIGLQPYRGLSLTTSIAAGLT